MFRRMILRIGDYVFVTRPLILIPVWSFFLLGTRSGRASAPWPAPGVHALYGFVCLTAIMITAYLINQVFDQESDRLNDKGHYLTRGIFGVRMVVAMALAFFVTASLTFQHVAAAQRWPLALALVLSLMYSLPPIRLCARPLLDLVANAVGYGGIAFVVGHFALDATPARALAHASPWVALVGATFLHTTILDVDGDRDSGKITSSVLLGVNASALLAAVLAIAGLVLSWAVTWRVYGDVSALVVLAISTPVFVWAWTRLRRAGGAGADIARVSSNTVQFATLAVTVAAAIVEPMYLALVVPLVIAARYYYRARFGVSYPGTGGVSDA